MKTENQKPETDAQKKNNDNEKLEMNQTENVALFRQTYIFKRACLIRL